MRCEHVREHLLEGTLEERSHLDTCPECRGLEQRILSEQSAFHTVLDAYEAQPATQKRRFPWLTTAIVVLAVAATLALVFYSLLPEPHPAPPAPATPPIEEVPDLGSDTPVRQETPPADPIRTTREQHWENSQLLWEERERAMRDAEQARTEAELRKRRATAPAPTPRTGPTPRQAPTAPPSPRRAVP